jgi:hypothetical protein
MKTATDLLHRRHRNASTELVFRDIKNARNLLIQTIESGNDSEIRNIFKSTTMRFQRVERDLLALCLAYADKDYVAAVGLLNDAYENFDTLMPEVRVRLANDRAETLRKRAEFAAAQEEMRVMAAAGLLYDGPDSLREALGGAD